MFSGGFRYATRRHTNTTTPEQQASRGSQHMMQAMARDRETSARVSSRRACLCGDGGVLRRSKRCQDRRCCCREVEFEVEVSDHAWQPDVAMELHLSG
ncbi:hypothetical protein KC19_2G145300 [Ceratodon purpureus]|uniref:Uncharacterized protein n=1 Tax=Ceratodon purpureus TaxID=3225 RepID=A0A8T0IW50_CERPU|nr:hypothetical protein KC19_2G145300 [Ceratodon purpureus]